MIGRRPAVAVRIHCPVATETVQALAAGDLDHVARDPLIDRMLALVRGSAPVGDFGLYRSVAELTLGAETFVPAPGASPALGRSGAVAWSATILVTVHVAADAPDGALDAFVDAVVAAHPWEVPVIELVELALVDR